MYLPQNGSQQHRKLDYATINSDSITHSEEKMSMSGMAFKSFVPALRTIGKINSAFHQSCVDKLSTTGFPLFY